MSTTGNIIPACLLAHAERPAWVAWAYMGRERRKVPYAPRTGRAASSTDPSTWGTLAEALRLAEARAYGGQRGGIGIVSRAVPDLVFLDLDRCMDPATGDPVNDDAARLLEASTSTYADTTPSGAGVRIIGTAPAIVATVSRKGSTPGALALEIYKGADRYLTVTGRRYGQHPDALDDIGDAVLDVLASLRGGGGADPGEAGRDAREDAELVRRIVTGEGYHLELLPLAARYIGRGMSASATAETLRGLMLAHPEAARDDRWRDRFRSVGDLVQSAVGKYAATAEHRRELARMAGRLLRDGNDPDDVLDAVRAEAFARGIPADQAHRIVCWCAEREVERRETAHG